MNMQYLEMNKTVQVRWRMDGEKAEVYTQHITPGTVQFTPLELYGCIIVIVRHS